MITQERSNTITGVLLAGGITVSKLQQALDRHVLEVHVAPGVRLLDHWINQLRQTADNLNAEAHAVVLLGKNTDEIHPEPPSRNEHPHAIDFEVKRETQQYRGPAGAIRDLDIGRPGHTIIAIEAVRLLTVPLAPIIQNHVQGDAHVTLAVNPDGSPAGITALRAETLELVPKAGFLDLKEQFVNKLKDSGKYVRGTRIPAPGTLPLKTRADFVEAIAQLEDNNHTQPELNGAAQNLERLGAGQHAASIHGGRVRSSIAPGAEVHPTATVLNSVIMPGARIGARAVVARSIVLPGAEVRKEATLIDSVASAKRTVSDTKPNRRRGAKA